MTRFLSEALQAPEPVFRLGLRHLEKINAYPGTDIHFSINIMQDAKAKLRELGLDSEDTTATELYRSLVNKLAEDEEHLIKKLRAAAASHVSAEGGVIDGMVHYLKQLNDQKNCFAIKNSRLKTILKSAPPKRTIKKLGYRSFDSCLKHEPAVLILAAAWMIEGAGWQKQILNIYKKLRPNDFEEREIQFLQPVSKRWQTLAIDSVIARRHNLLSFTETGSIILLPLPANMPSGMVTASLCLAIHQINEIRAASSFLKLNRVASDFGGVVKNIVNQMPHLSSELLDQPVPWHLVQRYFARHNNFRQELFEPHLERTDMIWQPVEDILAAIEPAFKFWQNTAHLGLIHNHQPVSLNVIDVALNACNQIPFGHRLVHYFQQSLWHELLLRYMQHEPVEQSVLKELQPQLAAETVIA